MTTRRRMLAVVLALVLALAACGDDDDAAAAPDDLLDGSPRIADDSGVLTAVADDFTTLELDGDTTYDVSDELLSFHAVDGSVQPVLRWVDQYVQVGLDGDTVVWLGGISAVVELADQPAVAYFSDVLAEIDDRDAIFRSGTVLPLGPDVAPPGAVPGAVVATIDVASGEVVSLEAG